MSDDLLKLVRKNIRALEPYHSARFLMKEKQGISFLDANECPYEPLPGVRGYSHYPDQQPSALVQGLAGLYDVGEDNLLVTRGADEGIEILVRTFCEPGHDHVLISSPTFPIYEHCAHVQGCEIKDVPLLADQGFQLDVKKILSAANKKTKLVFVCSPNNPTGNLMQAEDIKALAKGLKGRSLVVVDETYLNYTDQESLAGSIAELPNIVVLRTISKSHAAAGLRCGALIAHESLIPEIRKLLAVYPFPRPMIDAANEILKTKNIQRLDGKRQEIIVRRNWFIEELEKCVKVQEVFPADANFVLARFEDKKAVFDGAKKAGILVRDLSSHPMMQNCLRIAIGREQDMQTLLAVIKGDDLPQASRRKATVTRKTKETAITVSVDLDKAEPVRIETGVGFYDHMLEQVARHGGFSLTLECDGDLEIDAHHTIEDCAIALGQALREALGDKAGIERYGFVVPMDESIAEVTLDLSGRFYLDFDGDLPMEHIGEFPSDMVKHVFYSICENLKANCHIKVRGENTHHMAEACFKGFGRALGQAIRQSGSKESLPSTKGAL